MDTVAIKRLAARVPGLLPAYYFARRMTSTGYYPKVVAVHGASERTMAFLTTTDARVIAEIGIYRGDTSLAIAKWLDGAGTLHLFDFDELVDRAVVRLAAAGYTNVVRHGNSHRILDSYNWGLMKLIEAHEEPVFDYVFLDGAHTWAFDALAFLLVDRLLKPGGHIDFDDYGWTLAASPSMKPEVFRATRKLYTDEQIAHRQVAAVVDLLVKRDARYEEVVPNRIFRKVRA
jgi:predicted O-methyltransferase YrrM